MCRRGCRHSALFFATGGVPGKMIFAMAQHLELAGAGDAFHDGRLIAIAAQFFRAPLGANASNAFGLT